MAQQNAAASPPIPVSRSGAKVTVACKLPNGLILRLFRMEDRSEAVMGGGTRAIKAAVQVGGHVVIKGAEAPFGVVPKFPIVGGYALTHGVDAEFMEKWLADNADLDVVRNNLIFVSPSNEVATDRSEEQSAVRSGLEGLVPDNDPRIPRGVKTATKKDDA